MSKDNLRTGDILLAHRDKNDSIEDKTIEFFTHSPYVHAVVVVRDPWWTSPPLKGLYVFQAVQGPLSYTDVLTGSRYGITFNRYEDFICGRLWVDYRELYIDGKRADINNDPVLRDKFVNAFNNSHGKPYDFTLRKWACVGIDSYFRCGCCMKCCAPPQTDKFWCSALVSYVYVKCGFLPEGVDYSDQTPEDLAEVSLSDPYTLGVIKTIN
jgi:hypothetical protein